MTRAGTIGKKKVIVYSTGKREKSSVLLPLILGAAVLYYFYSKSQPAAVTPIPVPVTDPGLLANNGQSGSPVILPGGDVVNTNPFGYNKLIPIYTTPASDTTKQIMTTTGQQYFNSLKSVVTNPAWIAAFQQMTDNELYYSWWYVANYLSHNIPLLQSTLLLPTGQYDNSNPGNAELYNAIKAIHTKYSIF